MIFFNIYYIHLHYRYCNNSIKAKETLTLVQVVLLTPKLPNPTYPIGLGISLLFCYGKGYQISFVRLMFLWPKKDRVTSLLGIVLYDCT